MNIPPVVSRGNLLATALAVIASISLTGCMGQRLCQAPVSRQELHELRRATHEEMDLQLISGEKIREVEFLGRVGVAGQDFSVFENVKHEHILVRTDQIAAIRLAAEDTEKDRDEAGPGPKKGGEKAEKKQAGKAKDGDKSKARDEARGDKEEKDGPKDRKNKEEEDGE